MMSFYVKGSFFHLVRFQIILLFFNRFLVRKKITVFEYLRERNAIYTLFTAWTVQIVWLLFEDLKKDKRTIRSWVKAFEIFLSNETVLSPVFIWILIKKSFTNCPVLRFVYFYIKHCVIALSSNQNKKKYKEFVLSNDKCNDIKSFSFTQLFIQFGVSVYFRCIFLLSLLWELFGIIRRVVVSIGSEK